jgi:hypothetical protein
MATQRTVFPTDLGAEFDFGFLTPNKISVIYATQTAFGKVRIASSADIIAGAQGPVLDAASLPQIYSIFKADLISESGTWSNAVSNLTTTVNNYTRDIVELGEHIATVSMTVSVNNITLTASIGNETIERVDAVNALAESIGVLSASVASGNAEIWTQVYARATTDAALSSDISLLTTNLGTLSGSVSQEALTRATADTSLASLISSLESTVVANNSTATSALSSEAVTRSSADSALSTLVTNLTSTVNTNATAAAASVATEATARATADTANASAITTLTATVAGLNNVALAASITSEASARATADTANALAITALASSTGASLATVNSSMTTIAGNLGTATAAYTVNVDANGAVAGIQLISSGIHGSASSAFNIRADEFNVTLPGHDNKPVMSVHNVNGVAQLAFDGTIIGDTTVNTNSIVNNAVSNIASQSSAGDCDLWVTLSHAATVQILMQGNPGQITYPLDPVWFWWTANYPAYSRNSNHDGYGHVFGDSYAILRLVIDGIEVYNCNAALYITNDSLNFTVIWSQLLNPFFSMYLPALTAGAHRFQVYCRGLTTGLPIAGCSVSIVGLMK